MTRDKTTRSRGPVGSWGDIEAICCDCGYQEERGKGPPTRREPLLRCKLCHSLAVRFEWQPPDGGPKKVIHRQRSAKELAAVRAAVRAAHGVPKFVWCLMGQDAGQPLDEIIIRKEAERRTGGEFWWGHGTALGPHVEKVAIQNGGTLPALFSALKNQKQADNQNTYVWAGWLSVRKGRYGTYSSGTSLS
jgi:hypothetical protein